MNDPTDPPRDRLFADDPGMLVDFRFDSAVARVFPDMIRRSVPGYGEIIGLLGLFAERYTQPGSTLYDLGCSLGAASLAMRRRIPHPDCRIVAVDNAEAMLERAREHLAADPQPTPVELRCADLREVPIEDASVVVLNFTLQFIDPADRLPLLERIHHGLRPGGVLLLAEKIDFANELSHDFHTGMHLAFKRANGYSELEISRKRSALERVLIPDTLEQHRERLGWAGFQRIETWFQCFNFAALAAFK
ncbi:carboxy-S-adenosyl-L-methionine synthase CmoA [Thiohalobacter sp. IOR34]|uniref:carboxy-S-adenosyl-L-methionine synthase CmoA n=1 Tax=Thiohalobacter sp. IOR34 TaxID=3057176 RepID=UPI0025B211D1|nr:carboxy-S-adenosyl-L-methionine synthase CmoA [Thiohalobacter sp. IOR34]WJW76549.1 carboxy-S-adenosyl-L-methionine synthase CmoA [Thiohalobacter sp. IOR34]